MRFDVWDRLVGLHPHCAKKRPSHYDAALNARGSDGENPWADWVSQVEDDKGTQKTLRPPTPPAAPLTSSTVRLTHRGVSNFPLSSRIDLMSPLRRITQNMGQKMVCQCTEPP